MTIYELSKYHNTKLEIEQLQNTIEEIQTTIIGSSKISGMPMNKNNSSNPTERIAIKLAKLKTKLMDKTEKLIDEMNLIENFLSTVEDNEIRIIIRKRFLDGKTWEVIGKETNSDRSTPYYKLSNYLKVRSNDEFKKQK